MPDRIVEHEHTHGISVQTWLQGYFDKAGWGMIPPETAINGQVFAEVNHGRWIVRCPVCPSAALASERTKLFLCPECGSPENGNRWYAVIFPPFKRAIENVLLRRPMRNPNHAPTRNWLPGETVADLVAENTLQGIN